nr:unnamed protein product [Callosobruchus analis]
MPRKYAKKTARVEIDENRVKAAMKAVLTKRLSQYKAAQEYGVKRQTIQSRIKTLLKKKTLEEILRGFEDSGNESDDKIFHTVANIRLSKFSLQYKKRILWHI